MKQLTMSLELSGLDGKTHIWFPLPQQISGESEEWLNPLDFKIVTDNKYNNRSAYFLTTMTKYKISAVFPLSNNQDDTDNYEIFLQPNSMVQSDHQAIKNIAKTLTVGETDDSGKSKKCFDWVVGYLEYANPIRGLYSSLQALTDRKVDCGGFSTLFTSLLRASNIPTRCVFGWAVRSKYGYHAWVEFFDSKKSAWVPCDPSVTYLGSRTKLDGGFGFINDERVVFSVGEDINLVGDNFEWNVPLFQSPVVVSVDKNGTPQKFIEKLTWSVA
jgi:transglutaminase-like putative cysteine protease